MAVAASACGFILVLLGIFGACTGGIGDASLPAWMYPDGFAQHTRMCPNTEPPILVVPVNARSAGARMCKTLLAALIHDYRPVIINWESDKSGGAAQVEKVEAMYRFLQAPRSTTGELISDESLVFMMDGLDVWLQLPPPHLVARFRELVPADHGQAGLRVVIGADKKCWPNDQNGVSSDTCYREETLIDVAQETCRNAPNSTVPRGSFAPLNESE